MLYLKNIYYKYIIKNKLLLLNEANHKNIRLKF